MPEDRTRVDLLYTFPSNLRRSGAARLDVLPTEVSYKLGDGWLASE